MTSTRDPTHVICRMDEMPDPGSRSFTITSDDWPLRGFVVRRGREVFGYVNRCPHAGHPLNIFPNEFLTSDRALLICRSHGACFEIATGRCVAGPCVGAALISIPVSIDDGYVLLAEDPQRLARQFA